MLDELPVETTLYSLGNSPPGPPDRRTGERHLTLLRVGALIIGERRELCLIKNVSAGGMLIRAYCDIALGTPISIELKHGETISGVAQWIKDGCVGVTFDQPVDVIALLSGHRRARVRECRGSKSLESRGCARTDRPTARGRSTFRKAA